MVVMDMALAIAVGILIGVEYVADSIIIPLMKHYIHDGKKNGNNSNTRTTTTKNICYH